MHLARQLVAEHAPPVIRPRPRRFPAAEEEAGEDQRRGVGREMIAVDARPLEIAFGELAVQKQRAQKARLERFIGPGLTAAEHVEEPGPRDDPQGRFHRAGPVHAVRVRVRGNPLVNHLADVFGIAFLAGQQERLPGGNEPLQPRHFPRNLHVARAVQVDVIEIAHESRRPGAAGLEVAMPVDRGAQINRTGSEKVDTAGERLRCGLHDAAAVSRAGALVLVEGQAANGNGAGAVGQPRPELRNVRSSNHVGNRVDVQRGGAARRPKAVGTRVQLSQDAVEQNPGRPAQHAPDASEIRRHLSRGRWSFVVSGW